VKTSHIYPAARVALVVPCYNEAQTIESVIDSFQRSLPGIQCWVFDNNSTDDTKRKALDAGAFVRGVSEKGKGNVVRRMFADVDADVYIMVDGDGTYDASVAPALINLLEQEGLDMVVGARMSQDTAAYRAGHRWGNRMLTGAVSLLFGRVFEDMLSGYRVFSRRFVKSFPAHSHGFEIETELAVHALSLRLPVAEVKTSYGARPEGSVSKLSTYRDGLRILLTIVSLVKQEKPSLFFGLLFLVTLMASVGFAAPVLSTYLETGLVPRLPTAVLAASLGILAFLFLVCGLVLDTVTRGRAEAKRLAYLQVSQWKA
jgi:glycosyltransferase involved in cell wall biosynthesis